MLNNEKIILMTKLSLYEQKNQKKEIKTTDTIYKITSITIKAVSLPVVVRLDITLSDLYINHKTKQSKYATVIHKKDLSIFSDI